MRRNILAVGAARSSGVIRPCSSAVLCSTCTGEKVPSLMKAKRSGSSVLLLPGKGCLT